MGTLRYDDGSVTVTLDGGLEDFVRRALDAAGGETVRIMEAAAEEVRAKAAADWYAPGTGVTRRTGKSGDIQVITTVSPDEVRVSVGSPDIAKAKHVHRPGRLSTVAIEITQTEYKATRAKGGAQADLVFHARKDRPDAGVKAGNYYRLDGSPKAADGKFLVPELVRKPMRAKIKAITPDLARAITSKLGGV